MGRAAVKPKPLRTTLVDGAPSWRIANDVVDARITRNGGHLAPVTFRTSAGDIQPFSIAPWANEPLDPETPDLLKTLRGDFFAAPFGGNGTPWRGEQHPPHGETASSAWQTPRLTSGDGRQRFEAEMPQTIRSGHISKLIELRDGETNLYLRHTLKDMTGPMSLGHHAMIKCPDGDPGHIALSPFRSGQVLPDEFENPAIGGYSALKTDARFSNLQEVPLNSGGLTDLSRYPARDGFEDLVMVTTRPRQQPAWSTISFPDQGYLWFSLRDSAVLKSTVLWMSNGGRHYPPWNGRHRRVIGIEDVTSHFHYGLAESATKYQRTGSRAATTLHLNPKIPTVVNYIMGIVPIPKSFDRVKRLNFSTDQVQFCAISGASVTHQADWSFLQNRPQIS